MLWLVDHGLGTRRLDPAALRRENIVYLAVGALGGLCFFLGVWSGFWSREGKQLVLRGAGTAVAAIAALVAGFVTVIWLPRRGILIGRKFRPFMATCVSLFAFLDYVLLRDLLSHRETSSRPR